MAEEEYYGFDLDLDPAEIMFVNPIEKAHYMKKKEMAEAKRRAEEEAREKERQVSVSGPAASYAREGEGAPVRGGRTRVRVHVWACAGDGCLWSAAQHCPPQGVCRVPRAADTGCGLGEGAELFCLRCGGGSD